ncbi:hypothetical protein AHiyo8_03870 [Arthrobacter sp. Hiyo8]|nr:hypothetical protein AHiyo8_03870 [Arthrobacter sp. Hiyo8]
MCPLGKCGKVGVVVHDCAPAIGKDSREIRIHVAPVLGTIGRTALVIDGCGNSDDDQEDFLWLNARQGQGLVDGVPNGRSANTAALAVKGLGGARQDRAAQVGDDGGDRVLAGVDADDVAGIPAQAVPPGGLPLMYWPASRESPISSIQPCAASSSHKPRTVDRVRPVTAMASMALKASDSRA